MGLWAPFPGVQKPEILTRRFQRHARFVSVLLIHVIRAQEEMGTLDARCFCAHRHPTCAGH
jgi:hypothetical protein